MSSTDLEGFLRLSAEDEGELPPAESNTSGSRLAGLAGEFFLPTLPLWAADQGPPLPPAAPSTERPDREAVDRVTDVPRQADGTNRLDRLGGVDDDGSG